MILKALRLGMLLQIAVGPVSLMILITSSTYGFRLGLAIMTGVALVHAIFIFVSFVGVSTLISNNRVRTVIKLLGSLVLILFGLNNTIYTLFELSILPNIALFSGFSSEDPFIKGMIITASNPLTIVFWSGVLTTHLIENGWDRKQLFLFAVGCVIATMLYLTVIAFIGSITSTFFPYVNYSNDECSSRIYYCHIWTQTFAH